MRRNSIEGVSVDDGIGVPSGTMQSVLRSFAVLESVADLQPVGLSSLSRALALPKPTVARILKTLEHAGWLAPEGLPGEQRWVITARALTVGSKVMKQFDLRALARPIIARLGEETDENIHLSVPDGQALVLVDKIQSSRSVQTVAHVGERVPMFLTASGWAYLSRLDRDVIETYLPATMTAATDKTIIDRKQLFRELERVKECGYAINPGRWRSEISAVASAIVDHSGRPIGSLSISMPSYRLRPELHEPYGKLVGRATSELSAQIR